MLLPLDCILWMARAITRAPLFMPGRRPMMATVKIEPVLTPYRRSFAEILTVFSASPKQISTCSAWKIPAKYCCSARTRSAGMSSRALLWGGQISVAAGIVATAVTLLVGSLVGVIAGYYGGWIDETLMGTTELFLSLPWLYFLLGVRAFLPLHVSPARTFLLLTCVIGLIGWARPARIIRGVVLSTRTRNYVVAARGFGGSDFYLLRRHILPETFSVLLTQASLLVPRYIAAEATLSFFGLGVSEPVPSWGNMLSALQQYSVLVSYGWMLSPAAALFITSVIYYLLADALHSRLKSRQA